MLIKENLEVEERIRREWWRKYRSIQEQCPNHLNFSHAWLDWQWNDRNRRSCLDRPRSILVPPLPRRNVEPSFDDDEFRPMWPVDRSIRSFLYDGVSADHPQIDWSQGRTTYLKLRQKFAPNEKYSYPILSSMEISWQIYSKC